MKHYSELIRALPPRRLLAFDPGDHIGWAYFEKGVLIDYGESFERTHDDRLRWLGTIFDRLGRGPSYHVVYEAYRIYKRHMFDHINSDVPTLRIIGAIELLCVQRMIPYSSQSAAEGKGFVTDEKLKLWLPAMPASPHTRDAIRHGIHFLIHASGPTVEGTGRGR